MHAIVSVEKPASQREVIAGAWPAFRAETAHTQPLPEGTTQPAENVWHILLPSGSAVLANVLATAKSLGLRHRVLYFSEDPLEYAS